MDSMPVRDKGFETVLSGFPKNEVEQLLRYHRRNGGLSRYVKFRYFYEEIRKQKVDDAHVQKMAATFSDVMMQYLVNPDLLISDSVDFVKRSHAKIPMHVVSGSDGKELNEICRRLDIAKYFVSIHGSPTPKTQLVKDLLKKHNYPEHTVVLIGDSINDHHAAVENHIDFLGYNNSDLDSSNYRYIKSFEQVSL
jgi:phosphoglycolate phosphatase-like HAD superfamily hydrolase